MALEDMEERLRILKRKEEEKERFLENLQKKREEDAQRKQQEHEEKELQKQEKEKRRDQVFFVGDILLIISCSSGKISAFKSSRSLNFKGSISLKVLKKRRRRGKIK